ncbi:acyl-CoA dehydrogenase family protein [Streptomyces sp. ST2-7A]|uniref:acyl-CoA dehydrogenase family protein n=1 Tax=Streptomyces sp. ST2-7A TaxID=2907214 RepID=UPI001F20BE92|nr:acyl-CoA dehydrogenase family protein [Streptomyces sp. ST2-7A]
MTSTLSPEVRAQFREAAASSAHTATVDRAALVSLRESGLLATAVPERFGGAGGDGAAINRVVTEIATVNPSLAIIAFQHFAVTSRISEWGTEEQRHRLLPPLADGRLLAASAWSEPNAGAAKQNVSSTAVLRADGTWLLNGAKSFATGAGVADIYLVLVRTETTDDFGAEGQRAHYGASGQSFFLVWGTNPGLRPDTGPVLAGMRGSATGLIELVECVVPREDRLGPLGEAAEIIAGVRRTGATLGSVALGVAVEAFDLAVEHAERRGLLSLPTVRRHLVELSVKLESARAIVTLAGARSSADPGATTLRSKIHATETAEEICMDVARMLGSTGYLSDHPVARMIADVRGVALMGPTNDLCRTLLAATWER